MEKESEERMEVELSGKVPELAGDLHQMKSKFSHDVRRSVRVRATPECRGMSGTVQASLMMPGFCFLSFY